MKIVHGFGERKSITACGLSWVYDKKIPLEISCYKSEITCKRCLKSNNLELWDKK